MSTHKQQHTSGVSRRSVARGVAWSLPTIAVATAAPAFAASPRCVQGCPDLGFGGAVNANGWVTTQTGTFVGTSPDAAPPTRGPFNFSASFAPGTGGNLCTQGVSGGAGATAVTNAIIGVADPTSDASTATYSKTMNLLAGCTYTFSFSYAYYGPNPYGETLQASIRTPAGTLATNVGAVVDTGGGLQPNASGSRTVTYTPTVAGTYTFRYFWDYEDRPSYVTQCERSTADIGVSAPTITCG